MIRFRLTELLADRSFKEGRRIEWQEVAEGAGIHRTTLSRLLNVRGYNASVSNLDSLCRYFNCKLGELAEYVPDSEVEGPVEKSYRGPKPAVARASEMRPAAKRSAKKDKAVMTQPNPPKRPIGFVTPEDNGKKSSTPKNRAR